MSMEQLSLEVQRFGNKVFHLDKLVQQMEELEQEQGDGHLSMNGRRSGGSGGDSDSGEVSRMRSRVSVERTTCEEIAERLKRQIEDRISGRSSRDRRTMLMRDDDDVDDDDQGSGVVGSDRMLLEQKLAKRKRQLLKLKSQFEEMLLMLKRTEKRISTLERRRRQAQIQQSQKSTNLAGSARLSRRNSVDENEIEDDGLVVRRRGDQYVKNDDSLQMQQQMQMRKPKFQLSRADFNTVETERMIALETHEEISKLEAEFRDLHECFSDLRFLVQEQDEGINLMESNVKTAHRDVERAVENVRVAKSRTIGETMLKPFKLFKFF